VTIGLVCLLGIVFLGQELVRVALDLRNADGAYTLGVGHLRLSGFAGLATKLHWAGHVWVVIALWRFRRHRTWAEATVAGLVLAGVIAIHLLVHSMPLKQMINRPWIM